MDVAKVLLLKLFQVIIQIYSGKIKINGEDMKKIPGNKIRSRIVYINQKDFLFDASPEENCTLFFNYEVNPALVSAMGSDELLEKDYSTTMMSGGERQKIAFLRGFSRKSDVLICDEAEQPRIYWPKRDL